LLLPPPPTSTLFPYTTLFRSSTLSPENRSILYPSATISFVFSQAFGAQLPEWISFGKIRAAYAEVGSDTDVAPYSSNLFYGINSDRKSTRLNSSHVKISYAVF